MLWHWAALHGFVKLQSLPAQPVSLPNGSHAAGVTIAATGSKDRTVRLWGLAPLVPSPVQKPGIATLRGHGAPITCLAMAGGSLDGSEPSSSSASSSSSSATSGSWLLSGSLDARVKQWDAFHGSCVGTAKCGMPIAACQPVTAAPELQPHTLLVSGGTQVQLLDLRCLRPVAGVAVPAERGEAVHCFSQWGWDLAVGSSDGARVFDMRQLPSLGSSSSSIAAAGGVTAGPGRAASERLRLVGHARPVSGRAAQAVAVVTQSRLLGRLAVSAGGVQFGRCLAWVCCGPSAQSELSSQVFACFPLQVTSINVDRHKVVTATDRYGPAPVRVRSGWGG